MIHLNRTRWTLVVAGLAICLTGAAIAADEPDGPVSIVFDSFNVPTIVAQSEHDAIFVQGYLHARDRLFQMDLQRRAFSGTLAELVGPTVIPQDVQLRTLGLRRAAERSLPVQTPEVTAWLQAYSDGVNAFLQNTAEPLPLEYALLEVDRAGIAPWTPLDSIITAKGLAFNLSFSLGDIDRTIALLNFLGICPSIGCNGLQLLQDDLWRTAPFEATFSIPPNQAAPEDNPQAPEDEELPAYLSDPNFGTMVQEYRDAIADIPMLQRALETDSSQQGSNWWIASGALTDSGYPMITHDPHLALDTPATFYEVHLYVNGGINVTGTSFPGAPGIVLGCNDVVCWGSTVNAQDVTDVYNEVLLPLGPDPTVPTHIYRADGPPEPLQFIPQAYFFNVIGDGVPNNVLNAGVPPESGGLTFVVPRRNDGPIVQVSFDPTSPTPLTGVSVQYTGWGATQELETFRRFARAASMQDFKDALQYFDVGSQNWAYADINGNIAYYTSGEVPIREDLQTLFFPAGLNPPSLIRDGTHTLPHDWMPLTNPQPQQALGTEILPFAEMPQIENPASGYILNANNDPIGTTFDNVPWNQIRFGFNGLLYLSSGYASGYRSGRIERMFDDLLASAGTLSLAESIDVQANTQLLDAEILTPYLLDAYANATAEGAPPELTSIVDDPRVGDAIGRLAAWDFSTPTGINEGFDKGDNPAAPGPPSAAEVDASVAATIYALWRSQTVKRVIDVTLATLTGVCTGDFATLCSPSNDQCTAPGNPGGICFPVDLLSEFAPGSGQSMAALRNLLERYPINGGTGASLVNFFNVPGVADQDVARDIILLQSLVNGLDLLASDEFAPAFGNSTDLGDYRWGKLHRIVLAHPLGPALSIPPAGSPQNLAPDLPGFSVDGGMGSVDAAAHSARADGLNEFMFDSGPARRKIATMTPDGPEALEVIPGGESGVPGNPHQADQLPLWLVNANKPLPVSLEDVNATGVKTVTLGCGPDNGNSCLIAPQITCNSPAVSADAETCTAAVACDAIASCVDPEGNAVTLACDPSGPYGLGTTSVTVTCSDSQDTTVTACSTTVSDTTPPSILVGLTPDTLWPPNHHLVDVTANVTVSDACGSSTVVLASVESDEADNAIGDGDGNTFDDIQGEDIGTADSAFALRAERAGSGDGRTYTVTYTATDAAGNQATAVATVEVPHDGNPLMLSLEQSASGTMVTWLPRPEPEPYNVIRSTLSSITDQESVYDLGAVTCIESGSLDENTAGDEDDAVPASGEVFLYMVEYDDGGYGTVSAAKPRVPGSGGCQ